MFFLASLQGLPLRKRRYFFSETFAAIAFAAYSGMGNHHLSVADVDNELLDGNHIDKYGRGTIFTAEGCVANNGTKATPALTADLFGDWREELVMRTSDNQSLRIYTTIIPTTHRIITLMQDHQYRMSIIWQNAGYNQPPHTGFYLGKL